MLENYLPSTNKIGSIGRKVAVLIWAKGFTCKLLRARESEVWLRSSLVTRPKGDCSQVVAYLRSATSPKAFDLPARR